MHSKDLPVAEPRVAYLKDSFKPVDKADATLVKLTYPDGWVVFGRPAKPVDEKERLPKGVRYKSINEVLNDFENTLDRWVVDAANGNMSRGELRLQFTELLKDAGPQVYWEGMREGGIEQPLEEQDEKDEQTIDDWVEGQSEFVTGFASDAAEVAKLAGDERTAARDAMLDRVDIWVQSLRTLGGLGYASAKENAMGTWVLGATEEHCSTCASLDGQRHRMKWWVSKGYIPQEPGSETLECNGYRCLCYIEDDDGGRLLP